MFYCMNDLVKQILLSNNSLIQPHQKHNAAFFKGSSSTPAALILFSFCFQVITPSTSCSHTDVYKFQLFDLMGFFCLFFLTDYSFIHYAWVYK